MKDFAKSIRIGNATDKNGKELKVGDTVLVKTDDPSLNGGKIVRISGSQVSVDVTGDNDIWTTPGNLCTKIGNAKTGNSNKEEIIKKKKEQGATLKVDNGQKLEFSDGTTYVKTSFSDDYREAHNHVGNKAIVLKDGDVWVVLYANETKSKEFDTEAEARAFAKQAGNKKTGNKYEWTTRNGELQYFDYSVPFGGHKKGSVEKTSGGYTGYKMNGPVIISKKEFATEEEAKRYVETGNKKVGNGYIGMYAKTATERKFDDLLSEIEEGADIAAEFTFMSANASSARSQLDKIIQSANQAKQLISKLEQEPDSIFNRNK